MGFDRCHPPTMRLDPYNKTTITATMHEVETWRTRHYALATANNRNLIIFLAVQDSSISDPSE